MLFVFDCFDFGKKHLTILVILFYMRTRQAQVHTMKSIKNRYKTYNGIISCLGFFLSISRGNDTLLRYDEIDSRPTQTVVINWLVNNKPLCLYTCDPSRSFILVMQSSAWVIIRCWSGETTILYGSSTEPVDFKIDRSILVLSNTDVYHHLQAMKLNTRNNLVRNALTLTVGKIKSI